MKYCEHHKTTRASHSIKTGKRRVPLCLQCALDRLYRGHVVKRLVDGVNIKAITASRFEDWIIVPADTDVQLFEKV